MIEIPTSKGTILIDDDDWELVKPFHWYAVPAGGGGRYYAHAQWPPDLRSQVRLSRCLMHRLIMGAPTGIHVHHQNNNGLDNRKVNLELLEPRDHSRKHAPGQIGVYFDKSAKRFRAQLRVDGNQINLGLHADKAAALRAVALAKTLLPGLTPAQMRATAENIKLAAKTSTSSPLRQ